MKKKGNGYMSKENRDDFAAAEKAEKTTSRKRVGRALKWIIAVFVIALLAIAGFRIVTDRLAPQEETEEAAVNVRV
ncbi:MAG: hypothetical protein LBS24_05010, partial [Clostridiales Family XIII bacterium]|nr:hypothetical protein [Clostridiales Family XIII bacterium]